MNIMVSVVLRLTRKGYPENALTSMPFIYSDDALNNLDQTISTERLANYLVMVRGDRTKALRLYERNTVVGEGFYGILQALEIATRNSIHHILTTDMGRADWYDIPALLEPAEQKSILDAKTSILRGKKAIIPGRVIAELTFGFWIRLMTAKYEKTLWVPHIYKSFPGLPKPNRQKVFTRFDRIRNLRNRVAHHERIINRNLTRDYQDIFESLEWICPVTAAWVNSKSSLQRIFRR